MNTSAAVSVRKAVPGDADAILALVDGLAAYEKLPPPDAAAKARLIRDGAVVADNLAIESLKRFKDDATEVREGYECGIGLGSFNDIKVDDVIETFEMREKPRA